jgi:hypothetical protein
MNAPWAPAGRVELIARQVLLALLGLAVGAIGGVAIAAFAGWIEPWRFTC